MTLADIRTRLAGLEGRAYWRSLEELADTPEFREYVGREFPAQASEFTDPAGRRDFLKLMGASLALAGVSACTRQPTQKIVPYVRQPEEVVPGRPLFYATAMPQGGYGYPLLAENHMGRPTKLEGNPDHPASLGGTEIFSQTSVLSLYDPDRSRTIVNLGEVRTWASLQATLAPVMAGQKEAQGATLRLLTEPVSSPTLAAQIQTLLATYPQARWHQWDAVYGARQDGAADSHAIYHLEHADVVVALDADFLGFGAGSVRYSKDFAARRRMGTPEHELNRLYAIEPVPSVTGSNADHRLSLKSRDVHAFAAAIASGVGAGQAGTPAAGALSAEAQKWAQAIAADLSAHKGRSLVIAGDHQPAVVHALARAINDAAGNTGTTVTYMAPIVASPVDGSASLSELVADMRAGKVGALFIIGTNPVFTAPADLNFADALGKVGLRVHLGLYNDETAELCHWHIPEAHYLESWGDVRAFDGTVSLIQPLISPLYDGRTAIELLSALNGKPGVAPMDLVKEHWTTAWSAAGSPLKRRDGSAFANADSFWKNALHDGMIAGTGMIEDSRAQGSEGPRVQGSEGPRVQGSQGPKVQGSEGAKAQAAKGAKVQAAAAAVTSMPIPTAKSGTEIVFRPDPHVLDGRFANHGWLQELPKPLSKITWDNVAYISPAHAEKLGIPVFRSGNGNQKVIEIAYQGKTLRMPVWVLPGTADDTVVVHFGYGRRRAGKIGNGIGVDAFPIRTSRAPWFDGGATVTVTNETYLIASTQNHFLMEDRQPVRVTTADAYRKDPGLVERMAEHGETKKNGEPTMPGAGRSRTVPDVEPKGLPPTAGSLSPMDALGSLYPPREYKDYKWGMAIDLNACTGCGVCVAACVAENNIAVVGKTQVSRSREMHWIRVDTYYDGDPVAPRTYHQPMPCQQCENAPCEVVCPVAATVHSDEGLNDMVYNRCVGTRYCSNNCPYKVRRFNFMLYSDFVTPELYAQRNPDVTIRSRGVMEKCTYCVQRISHARIDAKTTGTGIADGAIQTACEQACPADAIVFGDINQTESRVSKLKAQERNYGVLVDLGTRPRTTYLAVVRNPNPAVQPAAQG
jgi:MoCo/4Fe-4S cofactor protein with predicted Tat translocation signal